MVVLRHHRSLAIGIFAFVLIAGTSAGTAGAAPPACLGRTATIVGTDRADQLTGTNAVDVIVGLGGDDRITGANGDDVICGGAGDDQITGGAGADLLDGADGIDTLDGGEGADDLRLGPNRYKEVPNDDGGLDEVLDQASGGPGDDVISGGDGIDVIDGGSGDDVLRGDADRDDLSGGLGNDLAYGGPGPDTWAPGESRSGETDRFYGGPDGDQAWGSNPDEPLLARQFLFGEAGDDDLEAGSAADVLDGGPGDDYMSPMAGDDDVRGGGGSDIVVYAENGRFSGNSPTAAYPSITVDLQSGRASGLGDDRLSSVEGAIGGPNADRLLGSSGADTFYLSEEVEDGEHVLRRIDLIDGRGGSDTIGPNTFGCCGMEVDLARGTARVGQDGTTAHLVSIENAVGTWTEDELRGDSGPNTLQGDGSSDVIDGRGGADRIWGDDGQGDVNTAGDRLYGGSGADLIYGGNGRDRIFGGSGPDTIYGGTGRDRLYGNSGRDRLYGNSGRDRLNGGSGADRLNGGSGRDRCVSPSRGARAQSCETR